MYAPSCISTRPACGFRASRPAGSAAHFSPHPTLWQFQDVWPQGSSLPRLCGRSNTGTHLRAGAVWPVLSATRALFCISTKLVCCSTEKSVPASTAHFCLGANPLPTRAQDMPASFQPKPFGYCSKGRPFLRPALHLAWACLPLMPFFASPPHLFVGIRCNLLRSAAVFQRMP